MTCLGGLPKPDPRDVFEFELRGPVISKGLSQNVAAVVVAPAGSLGACPPYLIEFADLLDLGPYCSD